MPASPYNSPVRSTASGGAMKKMASSGLFSGKTSTPAANPKAVGGTAMRNTLKSDRAATLPKKKGR